MAERSRKTQYPHVRRSKIPRYLGGFLRSAGAIVATIGGLIIDGVLIAPSAAAAPGEEFDAETPYVFVAQAGPTQLYQAVAGAGGAVDFEAIGASTTAVVYNAIGYNTADDYLYGVLVSTADETTLPKGALVRIGNDGTFTRVGTSIVPSPEDAVTNVGAFGDDGLLYVASSSDLAAYAVDVTSGEVLRTIPLTDPSDPTLAALRIADWAFTDGYFWGVDGNPDGESEFVRVDMSTGVVSRFAADLPDGEYGAAWTYGNGDTRGDGNLGFSHNDSGTIFQVSIADAASPTPQIAIVASSPGPANTINDGAASPGQPVDLAIEKTGPASLAPGGQVTYQLQVTNLGPGTSSGFVVTDAVPAPLTDAASPTLGCTVTGNDVTCTQGVLAPGASASLTITATVPAPLDAAVTNTAHVLGNELDPNVDNNEDSTQGAPGTMSLVKHAGTPVDVNADGIIDAGDTIQYTFTVTNNSGATLSAVAVTDAMVGAVTCDSVTLADGASTECRADDVHTITLEEQQLGTVANTAVSSGVLPGGTTLTSNEASTSTPVDTPMPALRLTKSADATLVDQAGQTITYRFVVENTGNVHISELEIVEGSFTGHGALSAITCADTTLRIGATVACTAEYRIVPEDVVVAGTVVNTATAHGIVNGTPVASDPSTATVRTVPAAPDLAVTGGVAPTVAVWAGVAVVVLGLVTLVIAWLRRRREASPRLHPDNGGEQR